MKREKTFLSLYYPAIYVRVVSCFLFRSTFTLLFISIPSISTHFIRERKSHTSQFSNQCVYFCSRTDISSSVVNNKPWVSEWMNEGRKVCCWDVENQEIHIKVNENVMQAHFCNSGFQFRKCTIHSHSHMYKWVKKSDKNRNREKISEIFLFLLLQPVN